MSCIFVRSYRATADEKLSDVNLTTKDKEDFIKRWQAQMQFDYEPDGEQQPQGEPTRLEEVVTKKEEEKKEETEVAPGVENQEGEDEETKEEETKEDGEENEGEEEEDDSVSAIVVTKRALRRRDTTYFRLVPLQQRKVI